MGQTASNVTPLPSRHKLRTVEVLCPAWSTGMTTIREATVRDYMDARKLADDQERTLHLLSRMVLDEDGKPVGLEAIYSAPMAALNQLSTHIPGLLEEELVKDPLT